MLVIKKQNHDYTQETSSQLLFINGEKVFQMNTYVSSESYKLCEFSKYPKHLGKYSCVRGHQRPAEYKGV